MAKKKETDEPQISAVFREVDDDLRQEKLENFWKEYGNTIIVAVVLLVLGTAVNSFWQSYSYKKHANQTDQLISYAQEAPELDDAARLEKLSALSADVKGGAGMLLSFQLAAEKYKAGDLDGALETYDEIEESASHDIYEDLAELQMIRIRMEKGDDTAELMEELEDLTESDAPFRFSARELLGLLKKQSGDIAGANQIFQNLSINGLAPESLRQRAAAYIEHVDVEEEQS